LKTFDVQLTDADKRGNLLLKLWCVCVWCLSVQDVELPEKVDVIVSEWMVSE